MKNLGIIQPGKIGDIVICLPIAKYYYDQGYTIHWPLWDRIYPNFQNQFDFVNFIPCRFDCNHAREILSNFPIQKNLELAFSIPNALAPLTHAYKYINQDYTFDQYKYILGRVPFSYKWNPSIQPKIDEKNVERLKQKYNITKETKYNLIQLDSSDQRISLPYSDDDIRIVPIDGISIFDWLGLVDDAHEIHLIESSFSNIIDQYSSRENGLYLYLKHGYYGSKLRNGNLRGIPVLRKNWIIK